MNPPVLARLADRDEDYARLGLRRDRVEPWEDGMRTTGGPGSYEWWYFDAHLEDGSSLVVTFYTKWMLHPKGPEAPMVQLNLERPGRPTRQVFVRATPQEFSASKERCDVRIKDCSFRGDLHTYRIRVVDEALTIDAELVGQVPSWRQATGFTYFGPADEHTFASATPFRWFNGVVGTSARALGSRSGEPSSNRAPVPARASCPNPSPPSPPTPSRAAGAPRTSRRGSRGSSSCSRGTSTSWRSSPRAPRSGSSV